MIQRRSGPSRIRLCKQVGTAPALWGVVAAVLLLIACSTPSPVGEQLDTVRVGMIDVGRWPLQIAKDKGFFKKEKLNVEFSYAGHFEPLMQSLREGKNDIGHQATTHPLKQIENGEDMVIFMGETRESSFALITQPGIKTYKGLKGKRLGGSGENGQDALLLRRMLVRNGLPENEFEMVYGFGPADRYTALKEKRIHGTMMGSPDRAVADGFTHLDDASKYIGEFQFSVALARKSWAQAHRDTLVRYIRAYVAGLNWMSQPYNKTAAVEVIARIGKMGTERAERSLAGVLESHSPKAELSVEGMKAVMENMAEFGLLPRPLPPVQKYIDLSYYREAVGR